MITNKREKNFFVASLTIYLQNVNEFLKDMRTRTHSELAGTLERTVFLPLFDTPLAEEFAAVVAFFGLPQNFQTNATNKLVAQLLVHDPVLYSIEVITARVHSWSSAGSIEHVYV